MIAKNSQAVRPTPAQLVTYALPVIPVGFLYGPLVVLQGIYATHFGLSLATIATVILIAKLFDGITDPLIGYWSDWYYVRTGSRKPFVVAGGLLFIITSYFFYVPPENVSSSYFLVCYLAFYFSATLFTIPHLALGGELTSCSTAKNSVYSMRLLAVYVGKLLFFVVPLLPFFETDEFTPQSLKWSALAGGALMLPFLYVCVMGVQVGARPAAANEVTKKKKIRRSLLVSMYANKPFLLLMSAVAIFATGGGMWFGMLFIFVDAYLVLGHKFALIFSICLVATTPAIWLGYMLANRLGKKHAMNVSIAIFIFSALGTGLLQPGLDSYFPLLAIMILMYIAIAIAGVASPSLLSDVADYGTLKCGVDYTASYFSMNALIGKITMAAGTALGMAIADNYDFSPTSTDHSADAVFGLHLAIVWLPGLFAMVSLVLIAFIPINAQRHAIIRRRLDCRMNRIASTV